MKNAEESAMPKLFKQKDGENGERFFYNNGGLTKREYFAGLAMQGILSNQTAISALTDITSDTSREDSGKKLSKVALLFADALLLELSKERE